MTQEFEVWLDKGHPMLPETASEETAQQGGFFISEVLQNHKKRTPLTGTRTAKNCYNVPRFRRTDFLFSMTVLC